MHSLMQSVLCFFIFHLKGVRLISIETMSSLRVILFLVWQRLLCLKDTGSISAICDKHFKYCVGCATFFGVNNLSFDVLGPIKKELCSDECTIFFNKMFMSWKTLQALRKKKATNNS